MTPRDDPASRHFSMLRGFQLADFLTLGNAACGAGSVLLAMLYMSTQSISHFLLSAALAPRQPSSQERRADLCVMGWARSDQRTRGVQTVELFYTEPQSTMMNLTNILDFIG